MKERTDLGQGVPDIYDPFLQTAVGNEGATVVYGNGVDDDFYPIPSWASPQSPEELIPEEEL